MPFKDEDVIGDHSIPLPTLKDRVFWHHHQQSDQARILQLLEEILEAVKPKKRRKRNH